MTPTSPGARTALVIAHPAHELRLFGWLAQYRPTVYVLTDGAGRHNRPRIARTASLLRRLGASLGSEFGALTDAAIYRDLLTLEHDALLRVTDRLALAFITDQTDVVVVDAHEDAFLSHDILNAITRAAVLAAGHVLGRNLPIYDYALERAPDECPPELCDNASWLQLETTLLDEKIKAARSYVEVSKEVDEALRSFGAAAFATECLRPVHDIERIRTPESRPIYEMYGEQMVAEGNYQQVVRFESHVLPFFERAANVAPRMESGKLVEAT